jgi:hypothetical protein
MYTTIAAQPGTRNAGTLVRDLATAHDNWMADTDRFLLPVADADATFWARWGAVRYVEDALLDRFQLERRLLDELRAFQTAEMKERLGMQADRLSRLLAEFRRLGGERGRARELAHTTRELLDALRLWYAEIELAAGGIQWADVSTEATRLLTEFNGGRCGWADAHL